MDPPLPVPGVPGTEDLSSLPLSAPPCPSPNEAGKVMGGGLVGKNTLWLAGKNTALDPEDEGGSFPLSCLPHRLYLLSVVGAHR